ncbi:MFS transporter [Planotetraspora kaengkrachanensis]|uniref:MFS transporter n=1 Tax=Planotetraspora kaengkrachanensis TaxID=575193 RepID=A0A8J3PV48_9ACTN|nr:MFS transporter [Planotetraspora kaengkrachanensis]GIG81516.1 MFS transporter [Planotetraspora kaengkrachanensis]
MTTLATAAPPVQRSRSWLLTVILVGQFMAILDVSIVNVAAPTLRTDLNAGGSALQLVISGYTIAYAMLLITGARLGGLLGYRKLFLYGLGLFTVASLMCGLAPSADLLIAFRLLQGAGAALMVPQVLSLIQLSFDGAARLKAISVYAAVISGAAVVGQVLGGLLVTADLFGTSWRPVFLVNVPIGVVLLIVGGKLLPTGHVPREQGVDVPGLLTLSLAVSLLVVPLVLGHEQDWPLWGWISMAASVVVFCAFLLVERRARHPLVPGHLLRTPGVSPAAAGIFLVMVTYGGYLFTMALHLQGALGDSALHAGLLFIPAAAMFGLTSLNWKRLPARLHRPMIVSATVLTALGELGLAAVLSDGGHHEVLLEVLFAVIGTGLAGAFSPLMTVALSHVPQSEAPDASGLMAMMLQLGQVVGVAAFGTLFLSLTPSAHAISVTSVGLAITALAAGVVALPLLRRR